MLWFSQPVSNHNKLVVMIYNPLIHINVLPRWNIYNRTRVTFIHQTAMTNILTIWFMSLYIYTIKQALFSRQQHSISVSSIHIYWHSNALYARSYAYSWFVATSSISVPIINGPPEWEGSKRINRNGERHQHIVPRGHSSKTFSTIHIYIYTFVMISQSIGRRVTPKKIYQGFIWFFY